MKFGLVGLPNVGKSSIFNKIIGQELAKASNFPFCTINPNSAMAHVLDEKIQKLGEMSGSKKIIFPRLECVDIAGLVKGASKGAGLGNQFLSHIRQVDMILHVVRCFQDPSIQHVNNKVDPLEDVDLINTELILADMDMCSKLLSNRKTASLYSKSQIALLGKCLKVLEQEKFVSTIVGSLSADDLKFVNDRGLITAKPMLYVANVDDETDFPSIESKLNGDAIALNLLDSDETVINLLIQKSYNAMGLITYYTTGPLETRGWSIRKGATAKKASGAIHSDFEKKFIAAAVRKYEKPEITKIEGADYIVQDGDICDFRIGR